MNDEPGNDTSPETPGKRKRQTKPAARSFRLRDAGGDGSTRVSFGADPYVSIGAGETFTTTDEGLAARLARQPLLEEVST